jgi:hypothetical protein
VITNLGSALAGAAFGRWFVAGFDAFVFRWFAAASTMIWTGLHVLNGLELSHADG